MKNGLKSIILSALIAALVGAPVSSRAQDAAENALQKINHLTSVAVAAFDTYSYKKANTKLERALTIAARRGMKKDPRLARVHILIGVAAVAGSNDLYRGLHSFVRALRLDPKIAIPQKLITPQLKQMFATAKKTVKLVGKPPKIRFSKSSKEPGKIKTSALGGPRGLAHVPLESAKRGFPIPVKVEPGIDIQAHKVFLFYRPAGKVKYQSSAMTKRGTIFRGAIPPTLTKGRYVHYYIEAKDKRGRLAGSFGSARSPTVIIIN